MIAFLNPFNGNDIKEIKRYIKIPFEIYLMPDFNLLPDEQKYITNDFLKNDPFTVVIKNEKAIFVEKIGMSEKHIFNAILKLFVKDK